MRTWEEEGIKLYNGDCLEVMDKLINRGVKVDLTVTSPPYDNLRNYKGTLEWNETIWRSIIDRLYKITADGGVVVWVVADATIRGSETGTSFKQALYFKEVGFNLHDTMIYQTSKQPMNDRRFQQCFEYMFVFSKGRNKTFNPILVDCKFAGKKMESTTYYNTDGSMKKRHGKKVVKNKKIKENIWFMNQNSRNGHPAVFPEQLANDHIISWSNEGDTVFDPMMGSGTVGKMAKINNRKFKGIEKVEEYFDISINRIGGDSIEETRQEEIQENCI